MSGKSIKLEIGTVYKKSANGVYLFRYQINGRRKAVSLKTKNQDEAVLEAKKLVPVVNGQPWKLFQPMSNTQEA